MNITRRFCKKCKKFKTIGEFKTRFRCKKCPTQTYSDWYKQNKKNRDEYTKKWRLENPEKVQAHKRKYGCKKRGVSAELVECKALLREIRKVINGEQSD